MENEKKELKDRTELNANELDKVNGGQFKPTSEKEDAYTYTCSTPPCFTAISCIGSSCPEHASCKRSMKY